MVDLWTFFEDGTFYSTVVDENDNEVLWVRSRDRRSVEKFVNFVGYNKNDILVWVGTDYAFRIAAYREDWAHFVENKVATSKATNFKNEVGRTKGVPKGFISALHEIWAVMFDFQGKVTKK